MIILLFSITNKKIRCVFKNIFTCIEILNEDKIEDFFEIDNYNNNNYDNEDIVIIHYLNGGNMKINSVHFINICNNNILHSVSIENGSSGSSIILLLRKFKIVDIHKAYYKYRKLNVEIFLNISLYFFVSFFKIVPKIYQLLFLLS